MAFRLNSKIWPLLTLPAAGLCLLLGVSLLRSVYVSRGESTRLAECRVAFEKRLELIWDLRDALAEPGQPKWAARAASARDFGRASTPGCISIQDWQELDGAILRYVETAERETIAKGLTGSPASAKVFRELVRTHSDRIRDLGNRQVTALALPLDRWTDALSLSVLACLIAILSVLLHRTYRGELHQRERAEWALRESESRYRALFDHVAEGVYQTSARGEILGANPALVQMLGFDSFEELMRVTVAKDLYVDPARRKELTSQLEREGHLREVEYELRRRDGKVITVLENARAVRNVAGQLDYYEGTLVDITARKEAERAASKHMSEVESARAQLEDQARQLLDQSFEIAAGRDRALQSSRRKSEFLANLSREFRAPMNGVVGMAQLLLDSDLSPQQREFAESVKASAARLIETIDDILEYGKLENSQIRFQSAEFSIRSVVADVLHRAAPRAEQKGLELVVLVRPGVADRMTGDSVRIRQILGHLLNNAIRFTDTGEVSLTVSAVPDGSGGLHVRFQVEDSGIGVAPEAMPFLFEPFAGPLPEPDGRGSRRKEGGGLALAISRKLVEQMGGQMGVESEPGQGSLFWFQLRLGAAPASNEPLDTPLRGRRALVVADSAAVRGAIVELLGGWGMYAAAASDGQQALQLLRLAQVRGESFDFALIDHDIPGDLGIALAQSILDDHGCGTPRLLLMVPYSQRAFCSEPLLEGIAGTLAKPIEESALSHCLMHALSSSRSNSTDSLASLNGAIQSGQTTILLVEDNTVNQHVMKRLLGKLGYEALVAPDAEAALETLRERTFAAILMDCHLPGMNGFEATSAIRASESGARRTPIIAMTASALPGDREKCLAAGMDDYISKPVSLDDLRLTLQRWLHTAPSTMAV